MKQGSVREDAVKALTGQVKFEEILLPHFAPGIGARHGNKAGCALQPDSSMAECGEGLEVASRPAAEIEDREGRLRFDMPQ